jgi:DNA-directed RNA polymerase subunit L
MNASVSASTSVSTMIEWNTEVLRTDLIANSDHHAMYENSNSKFGILRIDVPVLPISTQPLAILLNLDHSGSMDDPCADGRTKMQHIKHTIRNILRVLMIKLEENPELAIYMCIHIFAHDVENILQKYVKDNKENVVLDSDTLLDGCSRISRRTTERSPEEYGFVHITKKSTQWIMDEVERIVPWGCTNIELSLKQAKDRMDTFRETHPEFRMAHIQLTDGQATLGKSIPEDLKPFVDTSYRNIFVGYGEDHDGHLMTSLGELSATCEYKFVDIIENTGLVYGEILYNLLYPLHDSPVYLVMSNGAKIYDWHANEWVSDMTIPPLSGNSEKIFQILSDGTVPTDEICVHLYTDMMDDPFETAMSLPRLLCQETGVFEQNDLTHYWLRQLTQEHLYRVREFENERACGRVPMLSKPMLRRQTAYVDMDDMNLIDVPPELEIKHRHIKNALLEHFHELSVYYEAFMEVDTNKKQFVKVLMDDVYVAIQNMGTERGLMYTAARQTSQGRQSTYVPTGSSRQSTTMKTVDLYNGGKDQDHDYSYMPPSTESIYIPSVDNDRTSMMTQVQGYDHRDLNLSLSDTDDDDMVGDDGQDPEESKEYDGCGIRSEVEDIHAYSEGRQRSPSEYELLGESILGHDIGYDNHDVFNADYYYNNFHKTFTIEDMDDSMDLDVSDSAFQKTNLENDLNDLNNYLCYVPRKK